MKYYKLVEDKKESDMTHQEAIKRLEEIQIGLRHQSAIEYAINQLKKSEVFDEPLYMEINDIGDTYAAKRLVHGKFKGKFIASDGINETMHAWDNARQIKKHPLSFTEWVKNKELVENICEPIKVWRDNFLNEKINQYSEYLNQFKYK